MQSSKPAIIILIIIILCTVILIIFFKKVEYSRLFIHIYKETENNLLKENSDIYICMGCKNCLKKYKYL